VWDVRKFDKPLKVFEELPSFFETTQAIFSPDQRFIMTGSGSKKGDGGQGNLHFWDAESFEPVRTMGIVPDGSVVSMNWQPHLNQIVLGTTEGTRVLYSPSLSQKGACLCVGKHKRAADFDSTITAGVIHNPHALPMYKMDQGGKRKKENPRHGKETKLPQRPLSGPDGSGGMINPSSSFFSHALMKGVIQKDDRSEDPREVYLKKTDASQIKGHGGVNPYYKKGATDYSESAYAKTQPKPIFDYSAEDDDDDKK
jgi:WD repeat-containing protein 70